MTEQSKEPVSALMDGEVSDFELRRILDRMDDEPELYGAWRRYQLIGAVMRKEDVASADIDISDAVKNAIAKESVYDVQEVENTALDQHDHANTFWKPLTSMAVAASVTAMVIFGTQSFNQAETSQIADHRPNYTLPENPVSNEFIRAQFGNTTGAILLEKEPEIIRLSQGLEHYIEQHRHMLKAKQSGWVASWLPEGYQGLKQDVMAHAEVQVFSNGRNSFTVCIEDFGRQSVPEGVAQQDGMVAVGKRMGDKFVTVVGDVPLMIAERIASSIEPKK